MGQVRTVATVTMRTPWIYVLPALVALFLLLPSLYPEASTGGADILERYGAENYMETSRRLQQWRDDGVDGELVALEERALEALGRAREATDDKAFFQAAADYENVTLALVERGVWEDDELFMRANSLNVVRIAGLAEPVVYATVGELPALPYLALVYEQVPWLLWVGTPCLVAVAGVLSRTNWSPPSCLRPVGRFACGPSSSRRSAAYIRPSSWGVPWRCSSCSTARCWVMASSWCELDMRAGRPTAAEAVAGHPFCVVLYRGSPSLRSLEVRAQGGTGLTPENGEKTALEMPDDL